MAALAAKHAELRDIQALPPPTGFSRLLLFLSRLIDKEALIAKAETRELPDDLKKEQKRIGIEKRRLEGRLKRANVKERERLTGEKG